MCFPGSLSLTLERDERRLLLRRLVAGLKQGEEPLFDLEGECRVDLSSPGGAVTAQLAASVDRRAEAARPDSGPRGTSARGRAGEAAARFRAPPIDFGCRLSNIRFTPELTAELDTRLRLRADSISTDHLLLQVNNARYDGEFRGINTPRGIAFSTALRGSEPLSLPPLMELIVGSSQAGAAGPCGI